LTVLAEFERGPQNFAGLAGGSLDVIAIAGIKFLAGLLEQCGLVIEEVHLTRATVHEQLDDAPDFRPKMGRPCHSWLRFNATAQGGVESQQLR
jgi:hypothetical protein